MKILIGERANSNFGWKGRWNLDISANIEAFCEGPSRDRLEKYGLRWDKALNLLPPGRTRWGKKEVLEARHMAQMIMERWPDSMLILAGQRVCSAFSVAYLPLKFDVTPMGPSVLCIPHPSGLNRWWNDPQNVEDFVNAARKTA